MVHFIMFRSKVFNTLDSLDIDHVNMIIEHKESPTKCIVMKNKPKKLIHW